MLNLIKSDKPEILVLNASEWTKEAMYFHYSGLSIPDAIMGRYGHKQIKAALINETHGKCAYCESHITAIYPGDIEHILPKSKYPRWAFYWNNLTLACSICNNSKSDYASKSMPLLNPYKDNIDEHMLAAGPYLVHKNSSIVGEFTIKKLKLERPQLREKRREAIEVFQNMLDKYSRESDENLKDILRDELVEMLSTNKEYSFTLQSYAKAQNFTF